MLFKKIWRLIVRTFNFWYFNGDVFFQYVILLSAAILPYTITNAIVTTMSTIFENEISKFIFYIYEANKVLCSILLFAITLYYLRRDNSEKAFCYKNKYHDYPYMGFFLARILGVRKCLLARVPIGMQYKLLIKRTFQEYILDKPEETVENEVTVERIEPEADGKICIVISDTYPINVSRQIPDSLKKHGVIHIKGTVSARRVTNEALVKTVVHIVKQLPHQTDEVLLFATTNPYHNQLITDECFTCAGRGNIKWLTVYQQDSDGERKFSTSSYWRMRV